MHFGITTLPARTRWTRCDVPAPLLSWPGVMTLQSGSSFEKGPAGGVPRVRYRRLGAGPDRRVLQLDYPTP
jgi:hypothetical protein